MVYIKYYAMKNILEEIGVHIRSVHEYINDTHKYITDSCAENELEQWHFLSSNSKC